jgi:hypothetical protein
MKTAVEWLIGYINHLNENGYDFRPKYDENIVEQAKEMEKEQIIRAHLMARCYDTPNSYNEAEQYYNENYEKNI